MHKEPGYDMVPGSPLGDRLTVLTSDEPGIELGFFPPVELGYCNVGTFFCA